MTQHTQNDLPQHSMATTGNSGTQVSAYSESATESQGRAIMPAQDSHATQGLSLSGTNVVVILFALLAMIYGCARWLRRRSMTRGNGDFLPDNKLDPAQIQVRGRAAKPE